MIPESATISSAQTLGHSPTPSIQGGADPQSHLHAVTDVKSSSACSVQGLFELGASSDFLASVPISFARRHLVCGFGSSPGPLFVLCGSDTPWAVLDSLGRVLQRRIRRVCFQPECGLPYKDLIQIIDHVYQQRSGTVDRAVQSVGADLTQPSGPLREDVLDHVDRAPVVNLVNALLSEAVRLGASDLHLQPYEDRLAARVRVDGVLEDLVELPRSRQEEVISRVKVMARLDIAERRLPQDGRIAVRLGGRSIDLRIATIPTVFGERVVVRLLDREGRLLTLADLGMDAGDSRVVRRFIRADHGIVLVTGPTGSGKTTTLYAGLQELNSKDANIITLEDPIEYQLEGISQIQVSERKGLTFADGLRSVLRQDPDIIMVGEIRDQETAVMAVQSALTGHLVFSTLHTNDAASTIARLLDLGIEAFLVSSSLIGVVAQRLVRRRCRACSAISASGGVDRTQSCASCRGNGFRGRIGIFETLVVDDEVRRQIEHRASADEIRRVAVTRGMRTLRDCGLARVADGSTTVEEVHRATLDGEQ